MTGAVIALAVINPYLAIPLSLASHYATDLIPHYGFRQSEVLEKSFNKYLALDFVLSVFLMGILGLLFPQQKWLIWACMIVAAIPDLAWWFYRKSVKEWPKGLDRFTAWHFRLNARSHIDTPVYDGLWLVASVAVVFAFYLQ